MRRTIFILFSGFILLLALAACGAEEASVTGTTTYLQRIALPTGAKLTVRIEDVSRADAPAEVIGEQVLDMDSKSVPVDFNVKYDPAKIIGYAYSLSSRITDSTGKLLFITDTITPVITRGAPTSGIDLVMIQVQAP